MPAMNQVLSLLLVVCALTVAIPTLSEVKALQLATNNKFVKAVGHGLVRRADEHEDHDEDGSHEDHDEESSHGHHDEDRGSQCITKLAFDLGFSEVASEFGLLDEDNTVCSPSLHGNHSVETDEHGAADANVTCLSCDSVYDFALDLVLHLGLTLSQENGTRCLEEDEDEMIGGSDAQHTDPSKAYGYGFLMAMLVSSASLIGVLLVPCLKKKTNLYKYIFSLMIALGGSALFCDAVLHLIPHALELHAHDEDDGHAHEEEEEGIPSFIWKGCATIAGIYIFFLLEVALHAWSSHHHHRHTHSILETDDSSVNTNTDHELTPRKKKVVDDFPSEMDVTVPHGRCLSTSGETAAIIHPNESKEVGDCEQCDFSSEKSSGEHGYLKRFYHFLLNIKPLAWLIILGDGIHNFADGLALGAAISQSVALGISTTIALVFHEIPHEVGDYVILLASGMSWYSALTFNFLSALTALLGFFVGVAIGTESQVANGWILAVAAGIFIYIALVDLLPQLIHTKERGRVRMIMFVMTNIGFYLSFIVLLLIAIYEEDLDTLIKE